MNKAVNDRKDAKRKEDAAKKVVEGNNLSDLLKKMSPDQRHNGYNLLVNESSRSEVL